MFKNFTFKQVAMLVFMTVFTSLTALAQSTITGTITDGANGDPLIGATVSVKGTSIGSTTDVNGAYTLNNVPSSAKTLVFSYIGYLSQEAAITGSVMNLGLAVDDNLLGEVVVTGIVDLVKDRRTPVAVSTILKDEIIAKSAGNVEFPEILQNTPNVYVANQAGGFGDSQMFVRGFSQSNTAFLLNGQPINGMEDGNMYWSNWSGMSDIANAVQIQRGLGSSKLAISSVGGTINIVTQTIEKEKGGFARFMTGNDGYAKATVGYNSGLKSNGWAYSFLLDHWRADNKWANGTRGTGQNYFFSVGKKTANSSLNFLVTGAPQQHDQNYSKEFDYGNGFGYDINGLKWNPNAGTDNEGNYKTWRRNYYHKPIINLSWDLNINDLTTLSSVAYASFGRGGGTGPFGSTREFDIYRDGVADYYNADGSFDFGKIQEVNAGVDGGNGSYGNGNAIRSSINNHQWYGLITNLKKKTVGNISYNIGADFRFYKGDHFRQLVDLLGLNSYEDNYLNSTRADGHLITNTFNANPWSALFNYAKDGEDRIAYDYSEWINYQGLFGQVEYDFDKFTAFVQGAVSNQSYQREGRWADQGKSDVVNKIGFNLKGGASYSPNTNNTFFANVGYYSRQPFLDNIYSNVRYSNDFVSTDGVSTTDIANEEITGFELGYKFSKPKYAINVNLYHTTWGNRFQSVGASDFNANGTSIANASILFSGISQIHKGVEVDANFAVSEKVRFNTFITVGDWKYDGSSSYRVRDEDLGDIVGTGSAELTGVYVGEAPQVSYGASVNVKLSKAFNWYLDYNGYDKLYGFVDVEDVANAALTDAEYQSEKLDGFGVFNTGLSVKLGDVDLRGNVKNLFNNKYVSRRDQYGYYYGNGTTWNLSATYNF